MNASTSRKKGILLCYGKTPYTPGRYLEDALRSNGLRVDVYKQGIDFKNIDQRKYLAVLFVESPSEPPVKVRNINLVKIPKIFWIHHGRNRLKTNLKLEKIYKPDLILMAHSLHLAKYFNAPVKFFPFGVATNFYNSLKPLSDRKYDIAFVGGTNKRLYKNRIRSLETIKRKFNKKYKLSLDESLYLDEMANLYKNSKIVFNQSADTLKTINMRLFEGMGSGALILTDLVPDQSRLFIDGKHYVIYRNKRDMINKINYYLAHLKKAQSIATNGRKYAIKRYSYQQRAKDLINIIKQMN